jgi:hypothetical protein
MAKQKQDLGKTETNSFVKGLNKDNDSSFIPEGMWTHARNVINNTVEGNLGTLSGEPANYLCAVAGDTLIGGRKIIVGAVHLYSDKWLIFTAVHNDAQINSINSEIGLFEEDLCRYRIIVQDPCLNLNELHLIYGAAREREDCSWAAYWNDGFNPDRYLNIGDPQTWPGKDYVWIGNNTYSNGVSSLQWPGVPWVQDCTNNNGCITCEDTSALDCDKIRLARLMKTPCLQVTAGKAGGTLRNGSYFATIAYSIQGQKVTDWFSPSNVQPLWFEFDPQGALEITVDADTENFDEFILVVVANINQGAVAKQIGIYTTSTQTIYIDQIKEDLPAVPIEQLPIQTPVYEKCDQISEINNYLLRVGPTGKFDFNYQPLANLIRAQWVSVEYPADYYVQGGYKPSYLRDEVYSFFIRWVYDTGDKSSTYHIPGRPPGEFNGVSELIDVPGDPNTLFTEPGEEERLFEVVNTASMTPVSPPELLDDGGQIIARGNMAYWESTEYYPDKMPEVWNSSEEGGGPCFTGVTETTFDLCGKPIRHHKFPENITNNSLLTNHFFTDPVSNVTTIRLMGVEFENIICPKDNEGKDIKGIVAYEILRGSREGNKTIIAKGMLNNMRPYNIKGTTAQGRQGLYPNYPFNTILPPNPAQSSSSDALNTPNFANDPYIKVTLPNSTQEDDIFISEIPRNFTTFHSPDTNFRTPFLSTVELKLYGNLRGISEQNFIEPDQHPKHKLISNFASFIITLAGALEGLISIGGKKTVDQPTGSFTRLPYSDVNAVLTSAGGTISTTAGVWPISTNVPFGATGLGGFVGTYNTQYNNYFNSSAFLVDAFTGGSQLKGIHARLDRRLGRAAGGTYVGPTLTSELQAGQYLGLASALQTLVYYFSEGAELALNVIYAVLPYRQYALQMLAHGFYKDFNRNNANELYRFKIGDSFYLKDNIQDVKPYNNQLYRINNLKRQTSVVLRTTSGVGANTGPYFIPSTDPSLGPGGLYQLYENPTYYYDNSLVTIGTAEGNNLLGNLGNGDVITQDMFNQDNKAVQFNALIASHYGGIKVRIRNQYGQLEGIKQLPITPCEQKLSNANVYLTPTSATCFESGCNAKRKPVIHKIISRTPVFFNGDTYVNRYTEKNNMFFFYDWLYGQPDGFEYNYLLRQMIPRPRFWMNSEKFEVSDLNPFAGGFFDAPTLGSGPLPTNFYRLDNKNYDYKTDNITGAGYPGLFGAKESYFYLACSSVRDFFVESDVIVDYRETGAQAYEKFYNPYAYTDLPTLFNINPEVITKGNYYAYDYSLSISKLFTQYFSQGNLQTRYYDPRVASLCYTYRPDRIIYSLPQSFESTKDSWFVYLANNYKEFKDQISGVKNFARTGAFITFKNSSPVVFQGIDQLQTEGGVKVTLGDGGLFTQTPQSISLADAPYEYGSCQNKNSVIATPDGMYYISQNQGKIFKFGESLEEISQLGLKWWFIVYLPYKLTEDFPDYPYQDNPVAGIGCQSIYNNRDGITYFCKKDYKLRPEFAGRTTYDECTNRFIVDKNGRFKLGDPIIFQDASWTVSFDPKSKFFISFHDWHPDLLLPSKDTFLSIKFDSLWVHNSSCTNFCNFYDTPAVMEIELPITTGQTVTTLRSVEYILEAYRRYDCTDQFNILDQNFDHAFIYNPEQVSGHLHLNPFPKNNITLSLDYPIVNINSIDILCSKEENKYRFNQFWDITKDRGEFPIGSNYPPTGPVIPGTTILDGPKADERIWITEPNGYIRDLNPANLDYNKSELQRKKFRHYLNYLVLRKDIVADVDMILKLTNAKQVYSPR